MLGFEAPQEDQVIENHDTEQIEGDNIPLETSEEPPIRIYERKKKQRPKSKSPLGIPKRMLNFYSLVDYTETHIATGPVNGGSPHISDYQHPTTLIVGHNSSENLIGQKYTPMVVDSVHEPDSDKSENFVPTRPKSRKRKNPNPRRGTPAKVPKLNPAPPIVICLSDSEDDLVQLSGPVTNTCSIDVGYTGNILRPIALCVGGEIYCDENAPQNVKLLSSALEYRIKGKQNLINYSGSMWMVRLLDLD